LKQGFAVGILLAKYINFFTYLACTHCQQARDDTGSTRKHRNPEVTRSTRKALVATQRQYWWNIKHRKNAPATIAIVRRHTER